MPTDSFTCPRCGRVSYNRDDIANGYCGACHDWTGSSAKRVRVRVHVAGELVDDVEFTIGVGTRDLIGDLGARHGAAAQLAELVGKPYLVDIEFWDGEHVRFGTDADGMFWPVSVAFERLPEVLGNLYGDQ